jgi:hypothetical protein
MMNKKPKAVAKAKMQWARDMRAREVVICMVDEDGTDAA